MRAPLTLKILSGGTRTPFQRLRLLHACAKEWSGEAKKMYLTGLEGLDAQRAAPGGPTLNGYAHAWNEDSEPRPYEPTEPALPSTSYPWPVTRPQHLTDAMSAMPALPAMPTMSALPASSWASPLRVPLPEPVTKQFDEPLELPPHLSTMIEPFASVDPQEEAMKPSPYFHLPPPGLAAEQPLAGPMTMVANPKSVVPVASDVELPPGIKIFGIDYAGSMCTRVEWRIDDLNGKLQASMGRPLVSPPFAALGLPNLRLMVFPDGRETMKNARSSERKGLYTQMIKKGPLHGSLKLKADCLQCATVMTVNLIVGQVRAGPLVYDFSEQAIHGLDDFGVDWLKQVDRANGSLTVGIEILDVRPQP